MEYINIKTGKVLCVGGVRFKEKGIKERRTDREETRKRCVERESCSREPGEKYIERSFRRL